MTNTHIQYKFEQNIKETIRRHQMICPGDKVLCALSGGADSVCLFRVLISFRETFSFTLKAVHVNHMLRESAGRDEAFVERLCETYQIPLHCGSVDVKGYAKLHKMGTEEAARKLRYQVFEQEALKMGGAKIAVAHHMDDQAETILFHMCRGCGIDGLRGMAPVSGQIIRPLLGCSRAAIEEYLDAIGQSYVTDETNFENRYSRNMLRNEVMPVLSKNICEKAPRHIAETGEMIGGLESFLHDTVEQAYKDCVRKDETGSRIVLDIPTMSVLHPYLQSELVRFCLYRLCETKKDIARVHILDVLSLQKKQTGSALCLPYHMAATRSYDTLVLEISRPRREPGGGASVCAWQPFDEKSAAYKQKDSAYPAAGQRQDKTEHVLLLGAGKETAGFQKTIQMPDGRNLSLRIFSRPKDRNIPIKTYTKWFDYARIETCVVLRTPQTGDYFMLKDGHKKYLKDYMKNEKIPAAERAQRPVLAMGSHILYFVGGRITDAAKVTDGTDTILEVSIQTSL